MGVVKDLGGDYALLKVNAAVMFNDDGSLDGVLLLWGEHHLVRLGSSFEIHEVGIEGLKNLCNRAAQRDRFEIDDDGKDPFVRDPEAHERHDEEVKRQYEDGCL